MFSEVRLEVEAGLNTPGDNETQVRHLRVSGVQAEAERLRSPSSFLLRVSSRIQSNIHLQSDLSCTFDVRENHFSYLGKRVGNFRLYLLGKRLKPRLKPLFWKLTGLARQSQISAGFVGIKHLCKD